jgi:hypothetical protein
MSGPAEPATIAHVQLLLDSFAKDSPVNGTSAPVFRLMSDS